MTGAGRPFVIAAGGTGGHMFPAIALARELVTRGQLTVLACDARGARYLPPDLDTVRVSSASPSGSLLRKLKGLSLLALGFLQCLVLLIRLRPPAVVALGGYASAPVAVAARLLGIPLIIHEQNAVLGRANRLLAGRAARVALTFARTRSAEAVPPEKLLVTGNPVRSDIGALAGRAQALPEQDRPLRLLVIGGSQGARVLSEIVPAGIASLSPTQRAKLQLTQQCRPEDLERVHATYAALGFEADLRPFFDDLPVRLAEADLVISRSGASSVAEILVLGRPSFLVPYRYAADDHQRANAQVLADAGAAWMVGESELTPEAVTACLSEVLADPAGLQAMGKAARALARPDAAGRLADAVQAAATSSRTREALA